ncbi:MAG: indolepyruvate ferredoxin oxidoreductase family protein [Actinomycetota bacterium]
MALEQQSYRLADRYERTDGRVLLTGVQALARIPVDQLRADVAAGLRTAALVSGYPGSPLGGFDLEVARLLKQVPDLPIVHQPAVNEELGASAVMGSQLAPGRPDATYEGVLGIWYGKAPGLDRATDALRHGVFAGASRHGGAVVIVGDDPMAKSSTMPSSSDAALVDLHMPILYPGTVQDCLELGLHAVAMSRVSGLWSAMKIVTPVADGSGTVDLPALASPPVLPELLVDGEPWRCQPSAVFLGPRMVEVEREFREIRSVLALRYGIENDLNTIAVDPDDAWIGLVATGFTYQQLREALRRLGFDDEQALRDAGIRLLKLRMPVPFDQDLVRRFARGLSEIVVVEEKNPTLEWLIKDALYAASERPQVLGKTDDRGGPLMPSYGRLDADAIVVGLRNRLAARLDERLAPLEQVRPPAPRKLLPLSVNRTPFFCSGCPHNWGTKVPEDTLVGAGTGCHGMSLLMDPERVGETIGITAMGNEGAHWIGMAPFVDTDHIVQNFGDGTYLHSGQLAVQAAIGSGTTMTFKILYNDTVAMTGGQTPTQSLGVPELATVLLAQGAARVMITTDDVRGYDRAGLPAGVEVWDRTRIVEAQELLAGIDGVTVLIHHQACATELRRDRKRGRLPAPTTRIVINHRVCEGCGDCGDVSNCLSVQPLDTPLGRKTTIDQASCNLDLSCVEGDCPSFMTVPMAAAGRERSTGAGVELVEPPIDPARDRASLRLAGIGGTGVVTVAQVLATAAMLDGWDVSGLDQTGLSQKAGPVVSDVVLTRPGTGSTNLIGAGEADAILAFDQLVGASDGVLAAEGRTTRVIGSTHRTPTGAMISDPAIAYPDHDELTTRFDARIETTDLWMDASALAGGLVGEVATANVFVLGVAVQEGVVPIAPVAVESAIDLNGVAVEANRAAFTWGRRWALDREAVEAAATAGPGGPTVEVTELPAALAERVAALPATDGLREAVHLRAGDLVDYQDEAYARRFLDRVERVVAAEQAVAPDSVALARAAADGLHRVMAYKDEYEVARLLVAPEAEATIRAAGGDPDGVIYHLHPPMLRAMGMERKLRFGRRSRPLFRSLASGKRVRGTALDPFGRAKVRRLERQLIAEYDELVETLVFGLRSDNVAQAVEIASLIDRVRGYEDLKLRRVEEYRAAVSGALRSY